MIPLLSVLQSGTDAVYWQIVRSRCCAAPCIATPVPGKDSECLTVDVHFIALKGFDHLQGTSTQGGYVEILALEDPATFAALLQGAMHAQQYGIASLPQKLGHAVRHAIEESVPEGKADERAECIAQRTNASQSLQAFTASARYIRYS